MLGAVKNRWISSSVICKLGFHRGLCSVSNVMNLNDNDDNNVMKSNLLNLAEVEKILTDVRADNIKIIPVQNQSLTDHIVLATGRSEWHVRNIAQALIHKAKLKQKGCQTRLLPSVEGGKGGKWIVVDSGSLVIHALDEKMRAYYNLDALWTEEKSANSTSEENQDVENGLVKVRKKNNSKKRPVKSA